MSYHFLLIGSHSVFCSVHLNMTLAKQRTLSERMILNPRFNARRCQMIPLETNHNISPTLTDFPVLALATVDYHQRCGVLHLTNVYKEANVIATNLDKKKGALYVLG